MFGAVFFCAALPSRIISVSSLAAAGAAPISLWLFSYPTPLVTLRVFLAAMIVFRHRGNISVCSLALSQDSALLLVFNNYLDAAVLLPSAFVVVGCDRRARAETLG